MSRAFILLAVLVGVWAGSEAHAKKEKVTVTFKDSCHCIKCHAEYRWDVKIDEDEPGSNPITDVVPSAMGAWNGPGGIFDKDTDRKGKEKKWFRLTGRVSLVKLEADGDLHIQLVDDGADDGDVNVVVEVPDGEPWCQIRETVFGWVNHQFPIRIKDSKKFTLQRKPVVSVVGKAFYDAIHGEGDTSANRRPVPNNAAETTRQVTIWEIHPVMALEEK
jgi:hypothetical protein